MANRYMQTRGITVAVKVYDFSEPPKLLRDIGSWKKMTGRELDSEDVENGEDDKAGGLRSRSDMELDRKVTTDSAVLDNWLETHTGYPTIMVESRVGDDGLPYGGTTTYTGTVKGSKLPEGDDTANERARHAVTLRVNVKTAVSQ